MASERVKHLRGELFKAIGDGTLQDPVARIREKPVDSGFSSSTQMSFDVINGILYRLDLLGSLIRNFNTEGFLESHH